MAKEKFEDKVKKLESIINELESGNTPLDESILKYKDAMILVKECDKELKDIETQVSKIVTPDGLKDFNPEDDK